MGGPLNGTLGKNLFTVDIETLESMSAALNEYEGTVLIVSHNQAFLSGFCRELWVVRDDGFVETSHADTESFDEIFSQYRSSIGGGSRRDRQKRTANMAKKASKQRAGTQQSTALL